MAPRSSLMRAPESEAPLECYDLRFVDSQALHRAYARLSERSRIASTILDPASLRLRFLAEREDGDSLVEHIYLDGGLIWCSRHTEVASRPDDQIS